MILVNIAILYPTSRAGPYGSDTFSMLEMSRQLVDAGQAKWVLAPMSYFGLYPLSYPSGVPFLTAELKLTEDISWNSVPLVTSFLFSTFFVLVGFVFFRQFRLSDTLSAFLAGIMAFSPIFIYFTYQEITGRGFVLPLFLLSMFMILRSSLRMSLRLVLFGLLTLGIFSMHRSSFMILSIELIAAGSFALCPYLPRVRTTVKASVYLSIIALAFLLLIWPYVPGLREVLGDIPEVAFSYKMGLWQFRTGFLFHGDTLPILLGNLAVNYVGSMGLALLLLPIGLVVLYPVSRESMDRDIFPLLTLVVLTPMLWQSDYMQLMLLPYSYLIIGLAIYRRERLIGYASSLRRRLPVGRKKRKPLTTARVRVVASSLFVIGCMVFSAVLFHHRLNIKESATGISNWPSDSEVNLGVYVGNAQFGEHEYFVTASDLLDRRVRWYSEWQCPVSDPVILKASGYLSATSKDFSIAMDSHNYINYMFAFFDFKRFYVLNPEIPDRDLYYLCYEDIYGFFRLYFLNPNTAYASNRVSTQEAGISIVIEVNKMGDSAHNLYFGEGTLHSNFLGEISSSTYMMFRNDDFTAFLAAEPVPG
jgi:hypothetical protein